LTARDIAVLSAIALVVIAVFLFVAPIPQDPAYHAFADGRTLFGIANFWNVASNLPFLVVGAWGVAYVLRHGDAVCLPGLELAYIVFFSGVFLTAFGSAYYHLVPANDSLAWDRLPMTIGFAGLFAVIVGEYVSPRSGRLLVIPLLLVGIVSVEYWIWTESRDAGDLRLYALVQFLPMLMTPFILAMYKPVIGSSRYFWGMLGCYALSKVVEFLDVTIFAAGNALSGHSLKHLFAAAATAMVLLGLMRRSLPAGAANDD
jgi:hypothetical protein